MSVRITLRDHADVSMERKLVLNRKFAEVLMPHLFALDPYEAQKRAVRLRRQLEAAGVHVLDDVDAQLIEEYKAMRRDLLVYVQRVFPTMETTVPELT